MVVRLISIQKGEKKMESKEAVALELYKIISRIDENKQAKELEIFLSCLKAVKGVTPDDEEKWANFKQPNA
jgi:hypothetical protein